MSAAQLKTPRVVITIMILIAGYFLTGVEASASPQVNNYFVDDNGSGSTCTQAAPCLLSQALEKASPMNIYLAAGTYTGDPAADEVISITSDNVINLYGGWNGAVTGAVVRDPDTYVSIIDGENQRRGISIIWSVGVPLSPTITGLSITNGNASGLTSGCSGSSSTPSGCGGGIFFYSSSPLILDNEIYNNYASRNGAALTSGYGGGIYGAYDERSIISGNRIYQNVADDTRQGMGGGVMLSNSSATTEFDHNTVYENISAPLSLDTWGAGLGLYWDNSLVHDNVFSDNGAVGSTKVQGGAIFLWYGRPDIKDNHISGNYGHSTLDLGHLNGGNIIRNRLVNNHTTYGVVLGDTKRMTAECSPTDYTYVVNNFISQPEGTGMTLYGNGAESLCAYLYHNSIDDGDTGVEFTNDFTVSMVNNIISNHTTVGILVNPSVTLPTVDYTLFYNNGDNGFSGTHSLNGNPFYVNSASGDLHIDYNSMALDAGTNLATVTDDIDGETRPAGLQADIGADEYSSCIFLPLIRK